MKRGYPEGTPLPLMLSNILLNEPDYELEERGCQQCCRWPDGFVNLVRSGRADKLAMGKLGDFAYNLLSHPFRIFNIAK